MAKNRIDEVLRKIAGLEAERAEAEAERIKAEEAPARMADELQAARAELKAAYADADAEAVAKLRAKEQRQIADIMKRADELKAAIEELGQTHREIAAHHSGPRARIAPALYGALVQAETAWRMYGDGFTPGTLSAPPAAKAGAVMPSQRREGRLVTVGG